MTAPKQLEWLDDIPQMVKKIRQRLKMNTRQFAKACGVHRTYISMLESGRRTPSMAVLQRIRKVAAEERPVEKRK